MDKTQTELACQKAFQYYKDNWHLDDVGKSHHFWEKANQVHAYLRFAEIASKSFPDGDWYSLMRENDFFEEFWKELNLQLTPASGMWADDYGWAGLACLAVAKAYREMNFTSPTGHTWQDWRDKAFGCFMHMQQCANKPPSLSGRPVANGLSNAPLNKDSSDYLKNTVTNTMWLLLPITLYDWCITNPNDKPAPPVSPPVLLQTAYDQYRWFRNWINTKPNAKPDVWDQDIPFYFFRPLLPANARLLEDRPAAFPGDSNSYTYDPRVAVPWSPDGVWSGDQGLFLAGCALFFKYAPDLQLELNYLPAVVTEVQDSTKSWFAAVTWGVWWLLCNSQTGQDCVIREAPFSFTFTGLPIAYVCGRGVLARFMSLEPTLSFFRSIFTNNLYLFSNAYAQTALAIHNSDDGGQLRANWNSSNDISANQNFFKNFGTVRGKPVTKFDYSWTKMAPGNDDPNLWNNYCMMMGFDLYAAYIRSASWYPKIPSVNESTGLGGENGHGAPGKEVHEHVVPINGNVEAKHEHGEKRVD
jgi:hypothetical protein